MSTIGSPPRSSGDWDVPAVQVAADARARKQAADVEVLHEAASHSHSPSDRIAYALDESLLTHPEAPVTTDADAPAEWLAWLAARIAANEAARTNTGGK
ncbi:hypothetical protein [Streptomyces sp. NPDC059015]|uniref:hypothetical protein n=1 Tax=unclassified Streptomyces TaxID=2593676 RepID=UPI003687CCE4